jgi:hypothetical protein
MVRREQGERDPTMDDCARSLKALLVKRLRLRGVDRRRSAKHPS